MPGKISASSPADDEPPVEVRRAQPGDLKGLQAIEIAAFATDRISRRAMRALIASPTANLTVATRGNAVLGYSLLLRRRDARVARLYSLAVHPRATGKGLGRLLLAAAEHDAMQGGADRLRLEVRSDNAGAVRLYETGSYSLIGRIHDYYQDGCAALRYERRLSPAS